MTRRVFWLMLAWVAGQSSAIWAEQEPLRHDQVKPLLRLLHDPTNSLISDYRFLYIDGLLREQEQNCETSSSAVCAARAAGGLGQQNRWSSELQVPVAATQYHVDPSLPNGSCVAGATTDIAPLGQCRVGTLLTTSQLAVETGHEVRIGPTTDYVMLLKDRHAYQNAPDADRTLYAVALDVSDLMELSRFELVVADVSNLLNLSLNDGALPVQVNTGLRLCAQDAATSCVPPTDRLLDELDGHDVTYLLRSGVNHIGIVLRGLPEAGSQIWFRVTRPGEHDFAAPADDLLPSCGKVVSTGCKLTAHRPRCAANAGHECDASLRTYRCATQVRCGLPRNCQGDSCAGGNTPDFVQTLARLEMARQASHYLTDSNLFLFSGNAAQCRDKVAWGLADCCRADATGRSATNRQALAQLGISRAVRGIESLGSEHAYDTLFLNDQLANSLVGLGEGVQGITEAFSPSLSFYGLEVSVSNGAITYGFDPASFALAVSLAVLANLLECNHEEQRLGLQVGAGLCTKVRDWCSSRGLFGCREEREAYCCYNSRLARLIAGQANAQLGRAKDDCSGLKIKQLGDLDFSRIDLQEFVAELNPPDASAELARFRSENAAALRKSERRGSHWVELQ